TRIIRLLDGKVTDDSMPCGDGEEEAADEKKAGKRPSMSFLTALSLSLNNLMTKMGRTFLTAFAGSIGIIGIALILSLSNGINKYIERVQEDTLSSYPIVIRAESVDLSGVLTTLMGARAEKPGEEHELDAVYSSSVMSELINSFNNATVTTNNLKDFRLYLESDKEGIRSHISDIQYSYDLDLNVYVEDQGGTRRRADVEAMMREIYASLGVSAETFDRMNGKGMGFGNLRLWEEMLPGEDGAPVSDLLTEQYDLLYGHWPEKYDEIVLIVNENNEIGDMMLGAMGLKSMDEMVEEMRASGRGETIEIKSLSFSYEEICEKEFRLFLTPELYQKKLDGGYTLLTDTENGLSFLFDSDRGVTLRISGIIRQKEDAVAGMLSGALGYTAALTDYVIEETEKSEIVKAQRDDPATDVLLGLPFRTENDPLPGDEEKTELIREYASSAPAAQKADMFRFLSSDPGDDYVNAAVEQYMAGMDRATLEAQVTEYLAAQEKEGTDTGYITEYIAKMSDDELRDAISQALAAQIRKQYAEAAEKRLASFSPEQLAAMLDAGLASGQYGEAALIALYDEFMPATFSESTLKAVLKEIGYVDKESPAVINLYANTFRDKDAIADSIKAYNEGKEEEDRITYTDYVALLMSSVSTIINAISYVLVAFVAISLVVSSIMIGIITYISVLERTKEIGILRAIGASRRDVSRVFNAETLLEGFAAGAIGILVTLILILPINLIIRSLTGIGTLGAVLPVGGALILVAISMALTYVAGLIPSGIAARKDPVEALRSE
ncbi:MAG: ABC transporter permease, partial [Clostridia bacterium]|nr:ABC transporter permease [Clostridia bacterium]